MTPQLIVTKLETITGPGYGEDIITRLSTLISYQLISADIVAEGTVKVPWTTPYDNFSFSIAEEFLKTFLLRL